MFFSLILSVVISSICSAHEKKGAIRVSELSALPDPVGFAGMIAGVSHDSLIVGGGANFPPPGDKKIYHDSIYILDAPNGKWRKAKQRLPRPLAYAVSVTHRNRVICIGGNDDHRHFADVFAIVQTKTGVKIETLPSLPHPCSQMCGALVGEVVYIAGGLKTPDATKALKTFWALDLSASKLRWKKLKPWPGPERFQSVAGSLNGTFFLFSGIRLRNDKGKPARILPYLKDAYSFHPKTSKWKRLRDLPRPAPAGPPAISLMNSRLVLMSGADGSRIDIPWQKHPGFKNEIFAYDVAKDAWSKGGKMPKGSSRVTAPMTAWRGGYVIVSGERSPRIRSPKVYFLRP